VQFLVMDCRDVMVMMTVMLPGPVGGGDELCFTRGWAFVRISASITSGGAVSGNGLP
jgi:hypothetical protein